MRAVICDRKVHSPNHTVDWRGKNVFSSLNEGFDTWMAASYNQHQAFSHNLNRQRLLLNVAHQEERTWKRASGSDPWRENAGCLDHDTTATGKPEGDGCVDRLAVEGIMLLLYDSPTGELILEPAEVIPMGMRQHYKVDLGGVYPEARHVA